MSKNGMVRLFSVFLDISTHNNVFCKIQEKKIILGHLKETCFIIERFIETKLNVNRLEKLINFLW